MNKGWILCLVFISALFATGCFEEEDSCNIRTPGIYVEYSITEQSGSALAEVILWTGDSPGGTYLKLGACGDAISVNGTILNEFGGNPTVYRGTTTMADTYNIVFDRPDEGSYSSAITNMPEPVEIIAPSGDSFARDEPFDITWENNSSGQIDLQIDGDCFYIFEEKITDNGTHTVPADTFDALTTEEGNTCNATIELTRTVEGTLSENLKGTIVGKTTDSASFESTPAADETAQ